MVRYNRPEPMSNNENRERKPETKQPNPSNLLDPKTLEKGTPETLQTTYRVDNVNLETANSNIETSPTIDPKQQVEQRLREQGISLDDLQKLPKRLKKGIDLTQITRKQFEILKRKARRRTIAKRVVLSLISGVVVLSVGVFAYLYLVRPPLENVNEKKTMGYALNEWNVLVNKHLLSGALNENKQSYLGLEYDYASDNENLTKILDIVYENVKYEVPKVARKTIWGKEALDSEGRVITGFGNFNENIELKLTVVDWNKINFSVEEVKKAKEELGLNPENNPLPEEDNKKLFEHILLRKLTSNQEVTELVENAEKENNQGSEEQEKPEATTEQESGVEGEKTENTEEQSQKEDLTPQEQSAYNLKVVGESKSDNGFISLKTVLHKPEIVFNKKADRYFIDQKEDIFLDNFLFASPDFNNMVDRFQKVLAEGKEVTTKEWQEWVKLTPEQKKGKEEPLKFERKYSLPKPFIGAYQMQNPNGENGEGVLVPKQGTGKKDDPASIETPVDTVQRVVKKTEDGKETVVNHPIRVVMKSFKTEKDALNWFESKDIRNRGLTTNSRMKYFAYEMEVVNLGQEPITITDNTDLVDVNLNSLGRTGSIYGLKDTVTLEAGQKGKIETWGMTTSPQRAFLIWGKDFNREIEPIWFKVLSGGVSKNVEKK